MTTITALNDLVKPDLAALNELILNQLKADVSFIDELSNHIVKSGGKRLRPLTVILGAKAAGYTGQEHIELAASMEFFHTATLLHDDVVDDSDLRRGRKTANTIWGSKPSVLVGDFLFTRAFEVMLRSNNLRIIRLLAQTANAITQGEVMQLLNCNNPKASEQEYFQVIERKTAVLFSAAAQIGSILNACDESIIQSMARFGLEVGMAFQIVDDALDYNSKSDVIGKSIGEDLAQGKPTLPLIYALQNGNSQQRELIQLAITTGGIENLETILTTIHETKAIDYAYQVAKNHIDSAISCLHVLPKTAYRDALESLAHFALEREY